MIEPKKHVFSLKPSLEGEILSVDEAAAYLHVSSATVYNLARQGDIPANKVGSQWRFSRLALLEYVQGKNAVSHSGKGYSL